MNRQETAHEQRMPFADRDRDPIVVTANASDKRPAAEPRSARPATLSDDVIRDRREQAGD